MILGNIIYFFSKVKKNEGEMLINQFGRQKSCCIFARL
jgi:hypothetical protein